MTKSILAEADKLLRACAGQLSIDLRIGHLSIRPTTRACFETKEGKVFVNFSIDSVCMQNDMTNREHKESIFYEF